MIQGSGRRRDSMKARTVLVCACAIFVGFLVAEICCAPKSKATGRNWGPQSILYLKGRYGRRYASDNKEHHYKLNLEDFRDSNKRLKEDSQNTFKKSLSHPWDATVESTIAELGQQRTSRLFHSAHSTRLFEFNTNGISEHQKKIYSPKYGY